jgi:hypothetical protein
MWQFNPTNNKPSNIRSATMLAAARDELRAFAREGRFVRRVRAQVTQWQAPSHVNSGEPVVLRWQTAGAREVQVSLGGVYPFQHRGGAQGELRWVAESAGEVSVKLLLLSDEPDAQWLAHDAPAIEVRQPALSAVVSAARLQAVPSATVKLRWSTVGAVEVSMQRVSNGEAMRVPAQGVMSVPMGYAQDVLVVCATAADGRVAQAVCELVPEISAVYNNSETKRYAFNLSMMNQPLELRL